MQQTVQTSAKTPARSKAPEAIQADSDPRHYRPPSVSIQTQRAVDDILKRLKGMSQEDKKNDAELNDLMDRFHKVISTPLIATKVTERIAALSAKGQRGNVTMSFDMLDNATGRAWLEATVANDESLMEAWVLNTLDGAVFEFAFDPSLERSSSGVILRPPATAQPAGRSND